MAKWLKLKEAAKYLKMEKSKLYRLVNEGRIPTHKAGENQSNNTVVAVL